MEQLLAMEGLDRLSVSLSRIDKTSTATFRELHGFDGLTYIMSKHH